MSHILVFGDSVSYGRWDAKGGWVSQLINFYMEKDMNDPDFYHEVYNLSIDGDDSKKLVRRLEFELKQRLPQRGKVVVIFAIGKNDSCFVKNKKGFITSPKVFRKNMEKFVKISKKYSSKIFFVGTASINEIETMPVSWDKNLYYTNEYLERYNEIVESVCQENNIGFIELFEKFRKADYKRLLEDGLHPNSKGHKLIFETVKDYLANKKIT